MRNISLIQRILKQIQQNPDSHDQSWWGSIELAIEYDPKTFVPFPFNVAEHFCNTTACVAGWACILDSPEEILVVEADASKRESEKAVFDLGIPRPGDIDPVATEKLGISYDFSSVLFDPDRTHDEVIFLLNELLSDKSENAILEDLEAFSL